MSEFDIEQSRGRWSAWLVLHTTQRGEHFASNYKRHCHMFPYIHVTLQKWDCIPIDFLEVALKIKDFERKYKLMTIMEGRMPIRYSLILHGRKGTGKENIKYQHGCFIYYSPFNGTFKINKVNRKSKAFLAMLKSAKYYGGEIEAQDQEKISKEGKVMSKKQLEVRRRVLKNYKGFVSVK